MTNLKTTKNKNKNKTTPPNKTKNPPQKCHPTLPFGSSMLGFHLRPEAFQKMRKAKPEGNCFKAKFWTR